MKNVEMNSPRAKVLRDWLNTNHRAYFEYPVTVPQLAIWFAELEENGTVGIPARYTDSRVPVTFTLKDLVP